MPKTLHLQLSGESEKFFQELQQTGLNEREIIAKALWLLNKVHKTGRVALLKQNRIDSRETQDIVEYVFGLMDIDESSENEVKTENSSLSIQEWKVELNKAQEQLRQELKKKGLTREQMLEQQILDMEKLIENARRTLGEE